MVVVVALRTLAQSDNEQAPGEDSHVKLTSSCHRQVHKLPSLARVIHCAGRFHGEFPFPGIHTREIRKNWHVVFGVLFLVEG